MTGRDFDTPSVSLLMLMKNERHHMESNWPLIAGQQFDGPVEYIYIDSGSTDGTLEFMAAQGVQAHCIPPSDFHHGRTRNLAASRATNDILVLLSGDARPRDAHWLANLVRPFEDPDVGAVYGRQMPPAGMHPVRAQALRSEYGEIRQVRSVGEGDPLNPGLFRFSNANAAVRRALWERFPWDESLLLAEDQGQCRDLLLAGYRVVYDPEAAVIHGHERTLWGEFQFAVDNGLSLTRVGILNNPQIGGEFRYGLQRMRQDVSFFLRRGEVHHAVRCIVVAVLKWLGVQFGKREARLPRWLLRRISGGYGKLYK